MPWSRTWRMPEAAAVLDASPLILLSRISRLDLLLTLRRRLVVPVPVLEEVRAKGNQDPSVREIQQASYLEEVPALPVADSIRRWDLGRGESSVLAWVREQPGSSSLQIAGALILLCGTLAVRGWDIQTHGGVTLTERVNQWLYRGAYCVGSALVIVALAWS
jgi:hypothetical protein